MILNNPWVTYFLIWNIIHRASEDSFHTLLTISASPAPRGGGGCPSSRTFNPTGESVLEKKLKYNFVYQRT